MPSETFLYMKLKAHLSRGPWELLGGQPPSGTDHMPVLEIKAEFGGNRGSSDSFKPDLVAAVGLTVMVIEIKPTYDSTDVDKLWRFLNSTTRRINFARELQQRGVELKPSLSWGQVTFRGAVAYAGPTGDSRGLATFSWVGDEDTGYFQEINVGLD